MNIGPRGCSARRAVPSPRCACRIRQRPLALPPDLKVDPSMPSPQVRWRPADVPIRLVRALPVLGA
ncbi:hypothetical protein XEUV354_02105 [Xanthomonas euvesicatoria]|nr:hypothetical protein BHE83_10580 [Xanthomonas euvesicatoria pv. vesicatoria str. 85-10]APO89451.1 hypothetical protein BJD11_04700 [Xanthomonas euvesicatoria]AYO94563.1 hypothetical protein Xcom_05585 [Xanthomonas axonopodis pv. commiphoreae]KHL63767.1 hypothetical protein XEU66b_00895 [Xanthomonas euvesicatoria]KLA52929.1 hypothetical protein XEUV683_11950 [Xanthomonas euvesicatoria]